MLWNFRSDFAESYFKAWNIQVRLAWRVPKETHTYLVESYFAAGQTRLRSQIYGRYQKFVRKLMKSPSKEIRFLCNRITDSDVMKASSIYFKKLLPVNSIPENEVFRVRLLTTQLQIRESK